MAINAVSATLDKNLLSNDIYSTAASDYLHVPVVPADVQALFDLPAYSASVTQNGATQTPHVFRSINHEFGEDAFKDDYYQQDNHWIKISAIGRVSFSLTLTGQNYVNPKIISRYDDITPLYSGNTATFNIDKPGYYAFLPDEGVTTTKSVTGMGGLNANGDAISGSITKTTHQRPFFIFIMPPETNIPDPADVTYYYGPVSTILGKKLVTMVMETLPPTLAVFSWLMVIPFIFTNLLLSQVVFIPMRPTCLTLKFTVAD